MTSQAPIKDNLGARLACNHDLSVNCRDCRLNGICLPFALETPDIDRLDRIIQRGRPLRKGGHLYRQGDEFASVYAVRS